MEFEIKTKRRRERQDPSHFALVYDPSGEE
jgi:hypothetical protein